MRIIRCLVLTLIACLSLSLAAPSYAQSKADLAKAKELVTKADGLFKTNDVEEALKLYKEAYILSNRPEVQFNMGQCYRALKDYENAIKSYKRFLAEYKKQSSLVEKAKTFLQESEDALEKQEQEELAQKKREEEERKQREEEERARQAAIEEAKRQEEERLAEERRLALLAAQDKPFERPARAKRFTRIGLLSASTAAISGGAALFLSQQVRQAAPTSSADASGAQLQQKILLAQSLGVASDALVGVAALTLSIGLISNQRAKNQWESRATVSLSPASVGIALEF